MVDLSILPLSPQKGGLISPRGVVHFRFEDPLLSHICLKYRWTHRIFEFFIWFASLATSTGSQDSLDNKKNGHCLTNNMKMQIYICNGTQGKFFFFKFVNDLMNKGMSYIWRQKCKLAQGPI